ncbi:MAG: hypothetical protein WBB15_11265 [Ornithinimicrobium sp.]
MVWRSRRLRATTEPGGERNGSTTTHPSTTAVTGSGSSTAREPATGSEPATGGPPAARSSRRRGCGDSPPAPTNPPVGGPVSAGWREGTLTRVKELTTLCDWAATTTDVAGYWIFVESIQQHLEAAKQAANFMKAQPKDRFPRPRTGSLRERAKSNIDAAEAQLLNFAPPTYVLGQLPGLLTHVQCHLIPTDPRRLAFERLARRLGVHDVDHPPQQATERAPRGEPTTQDRFAVVEEERGSIVTAARAASSASLREQVRVRSFRDVLVVTTALLSLLVVAMAVIGFARPAMIPLCFAPEDGGQAVVVCPTAQSQPFSTSSQPGTDTPSAADQARDIDDYLQATVSPWDILVVELVGLAAAAVAAAGAIRGIHGSSERPLLPVALAVLKLPTGALTAFLGLLLMRGQFIPGLSALDTSAQILAWALVFGYAQQLFTRLVDRQGQTVLNSVRGADDGKPQMAPP